MSEVNTQPADAQQNNQSGNGNAAGNSNQTSTPTYTQQQLDSKARAVCVKNGECLPLL